MKILVTGAGALLGQGVIRSLQSSSLETSIVAVDPSPLAAGLYWADAHYLVPMASEPDYVNALMSILEREKPDAVLVGTDVELGVLSEKREFIEAQTGTHVVVADPQAVAIADDKLLTCDFLREKGFDPPESRPGERADELADTLGFPLVVKPRVGARSVGVSVVKNAAELAYTLEQGENLVVQEFLPEDLGEFTAGTLTFDGHCDASIVMRRDLRDGNTYRAFTVFDPEIDAQVRDMAEALNAYGPANFQFRVTSGRVRVFEINCRFSGTTPLRALAGFNEVEMVLRHVLLGERVLQPRVEAVTVLRHWSETLLRNDQIVG